MTDAGASDARPSETWPGDGDSSPPSTHHDVVARVATFVSWLGFAGYVVWQGTTGQPLVWTDTTSYAAVAAQPLWSTGFWAGQRPPLIPLVLKVAGTDTGFVALQSVVAVAAWGFLAFTVGRLVPAGWRRLLASVLVLGFATSTPITLWNRSVLSESLSLSLLALLVATTIWTARRVTWPRVAAVAASAVAFAATRDAQVWTVAVLGVVVALVTLVRTRRQRRLPRHLSVLALSLLVAAGATGWTAFHTGRTEENVADVLYVRVFPFPSRVAWFAAHGMPDARAIDRAAVTAKPPEPGGAKAVFPQELGPAYDSLEPWIVAHGTTTYLLWLVTHPTYVLTEPLLRPERAYNFASGDLTFYAPPDRVGSPLSPLLWPAWWWLLPMTAVGLVIAVVGARWRERSWQTVVVFGGLGILTMLVAWHGDGQEVTRHTVEGFALVRVSVLILALVGLLGAPPARPSVGAR